MNKHGVVILSEDFPVPTRSIWRLLGHAARHPMLANGAPAPGFEELARAIFAVGAWMREVEHELGYPLCGDDHKAAELHPDEARLGVCPFCHLNDRSLAVGDDVWGICHSHQVRWKIPEGTEIGFFAFDGTEFWEASENPVREYPVVSPALLLEERAGGPVSWVKALVRKLFPKSEHEHNSLRTRDSVGA